MRAVDPRPCLAALALSLAPASPARAASTCDKQSANAQALFDEGRAFLDEGRIEVACDRLAESQQIEPTVGTLGLLAACHERQGRLIAALSEYVEAATRAASCGDEREAFAWDRAADVHLRLPRLRVERADRDAVIEIRRGHALVQPRTIGDDIVIDPGRVELAVRAPGKEEFRSIVELAEGARVRVIVPPLAPARPPPPVKRPAEQARLAPAR